jgi:menaquinol-cytochrome c reductase iron-sulfur subunit
MSGHAQGEELSRRGFVTGVIAIMGGLMSAFIGLPAIAYLVAPGLKKSATDAWVTLGPVDALVVGEPAFYTFSRARRIGWEVNATSYGIFVIKKGEGDYDVLSNICTHLKCHVSWKKDLNHFVSPCHNGHFAKDGTVISGPPPRPLDRFEYRVESGRLSVHILET